MQLFCRFLLGLLQAENDVPDQHDIFNIYFAVALKQQSDITPQQH